MCRCEHGALGTSANAGTAVASHRGLRLLWHLNAAWIAEVQDFQTHRQVDKQLLDLRVQHNFDCGLDCTLILWHVTVGDPSSMRLYGSFTSATSTLIPHLLWPKVARDPGEAEPAQRAAACEHRHVLWRP